jgi:hypothetical protein
MADPLIHLSNELPLAVFPEEQALVVQYGLISKPRPTGKLKPLSSRRIGLVQSTLEGVHCGSGTLQSLPVEWQSSICG